MMQIVPGVLVLMCCSALSAQQASAVDKATLQLLLAKIDQLESRVSELEGHRQEACGYNVAASSVAASPVAMKTRSTLALPEPARVADAPSQAAPTTASGTEQTQVDNGMNDRMDLSKTLLRIRGFADISLHGGTQQGDKTSFSLGQLDLFVTSDISDKYSFLGELVFEAGPDNIYGVNVGTANSFDIDIERYLLQYSANDYFNLSVGRGHTAIGYYNTAYHHSTWLQTTTDRPYLFQFEDRGGILPTHTVGAHAYGMLPSGRLGLHYVAEIGNGREAQSPLTQEPVQNDFDDSNHKAYNLALFARPESLRGFQTGFSLYRDMLNPTNMPKVSETIAAAHAIFIRPKFEWLNEVVLDRHVPVGISKVFDTPGFYSQISKQFRAYRPYLRYEYMNAPNNEPIFPAVGLRHGPLAGIRYDANESVAFKFQYDYTFLRNQPGINELTTQVGFTF
jgi:hypothetical protein